MGNRSITASALHTFIHGWLPWIIVGVATAWALGAIWWMLLDPAPDTTDELVIPAGTAARVAEGEPSPFIPTALALAPGRKLRIVNHDVVSHRVGTAELPPGGTAVLEAPGDSGEFVCTVHPGGVIGFRVAGRASFLSTTAWPAAGLGIPAGLLIAFVVAITRRLDTEPASAL